MVKHYKDYTENEKKLIVEDMMNSNLTYQEIMKKHSIGGRCYRKIKEEFNIRKVANRKKKFSVNDDYFEKIDTEEKAYWLGFMYADGCIRKNGNYYIIKIDLAAYEYDHIVKFKNAINATYNIQMYNYKYSGNSRLILGSEKMFKDLVNLGCKPNKTSILKFPTVKQVPEILLRHFIRGYFDGDGTINIMKNFKVPQARFQLLGTMDFLNGFCKYIEPYIGNVNIHPSRGIYYIQIGGNKKTKVIFDLMYNNSTIYLQRKYDIYFNHFYK